MSKSVVIAIAVVSIIFLERIVLGVAAITAGTGSLLGLALTGGISALILVGIIKGHKLAWQWGRILGLVGAIIMSLITVMIFANPNPENSLFGVISGSQAILLFILFFAIGTTDARIHFRLICPKCGSMKTKAANFFFTKARCKTCNIEW